MSSSQGNDSKSDLPGEFSGRNVIITGGAGFIGSALARVLVGRGAHVTILDSFLDGSGAHPRNLAPVEDAVTLVRKDLRHVGDLEDLLTDVEVIFNLAAQTSHRASMENPTVDLESNVQGQLALLEAVRASTATPTVVFSSTRQVYGPPQKLPVAEDHPINPVDINGIHKLAGEHYHRLYTRLYGIPTSVLRLTNVYGPGMRICDARQMFLGVWIKRLLKGMPILVYGDGTQERDLIFVDDAVDALLSAAYHSRAIGEAYNVGTPDSHTLVTIAKELVEIHGGGEIEKVPFPEEREKIDIGSYRSDITKITDQLGWEPSVGLSDGLDRTLAFYEEEFKAYVGEATA